MGTFNEGFPGKIISLLVDTEMPRLEKLCRKMLRNLLETTPGDADKKIEADDMQLRFIDEIVTFIDETALPLVIEPKKLLGWLENVRTVLVEKLLELTADATN